MMMKFRVKIAWFLLAVLWLVLLPSELTAQTTGAFMDTGKHWANETLHWAKERGIASGYPDGSFKPNAEINEAEFISLLYRAYGVDTSAGVWPEGAYAYASQMNYPLIGLDDKASRKAAITRTYVAEMIAWVDGKALHGTDAIQYLLDSGYSRGKEAATIQGYHGDDQLSRAEAVQFIKNLFDAGLRELRALPGPVEEQPSLQLYRIGSLAVGDSVAKVIAERGEPARKDQSQYGFTWYVYNESYADFAMIGIDNGRVVALYTNALNVLEVGIAPGKSRADVQAAFGEPLTTIKKGNTIYHLGYDPEEAGVYLLDGQYITFYYDSHDQGTIMAVKIVEEQTELALSGYYGTVTEEVLTAYERQLFDLVNVERTKRGLTVFKWDDRAAIAARLHSEDMGNRNFFQHDNPDGLSPFDRMVNQQISYVLAAENIAAGQVDAMNAHAGWMNSSGHRRNLLGAAARLGVGAAYVADSTYNLYYTQNFYSARGD